MQFPDKEQNLAEELVSLQSPVTWSLCLCSLGVTPPQCTSSEEDRDVVFPFVVAPELRASANDLFVTKTGGSGAGCRLAKPEQSRWIRQFNLSKDAGGQICKTGD